MNYKLVNGKAFMLLSSEGSTGLRINEIGSETVKAWKVVYANWNPLIDGRKKKVLPVHGSPKTTKTKTTGSNQSQNRVNWSGLKCVFTDGFYEKQLPL